MTDRVNMDEILGNFGTDEEKKAMKPIDEGHCADLNDLIVPKIEFEDLMHYDASHQVCYVNVNVF